jgi:5-methylcytosine-specific restriction endonuclease McrA
MLGYIAEVDSRRLHAPAGYPSMYAYLVGHWHMSEDSAYKRIRAARAARDCPEILDLVADGRLNLSSVVALAPRLTRENAGELLRAAVHKTRAEIEMLLARRFPQPDVPTVFRPLPSSPAPCQLAPGPVSLSTAELGPALRPLCGPPTTVMAVAPQPPGSPAGTMAPEVPRARLAPLAPERFALQVTVDQETHDLVRYAQALLGQAMPAGDVGQVLKRALETLVSELERRKLGAASQTRPRTRRRSGSRTRELSERYIPTAVRRVVWERDQGRCTFVSDRGKRCDACARLEFDHVTPVARGGLSTASNVRLRCRTHNQYEAEREFGDAFMRGKRERKGEVGSTTSRASAPREVNPDATSTGPRVDALATSGSS